MTNNPKNRQKWIFDLLKVEGLGYGECFGKFSVKFSRTERTFDKDWKKANARYLEYQQRADKAKEEVSIANEIKVLKSGLKTKNQRLLFYQSQIELMEKQLTGETKTYFIVNNKPIVNPNSNGDYILPLEKQNEVRKQIKDYQTEISKIEGDYAAIRTEADVKVVDEFRGKTLDELKELQKSYDNKINDG